jgi:hypothetical protein
MKIINKNGLRILTPRVGYRLANKERTQVYDTVVYLGKLDSMDNYVELTQEEAEQLRKELEENEIHIEE